MCHSTPLCMRGACDDSCVGPQGTDPDYGTLKGLDLVSFLQHLQHYVARTGSSVLKQAPDALTFDHADPIIAHRECAA